MSDTIITPEIIAQHNLTTEEYEKIKSIMGREPNMTELGVFSVMWSEHCSYKSSRVHLKRLPTTGKRVIVPPGENAGVVDIGDDWCVAFKVESHNHPSFIEPFQGAATGVGGILRDVFTMGARPVAAMNSLRFGPLDDKKHGNRNKSILKGCVEGIGHYGNCFGVPTVGGEVVFDESYSLNPLVNTFALGIVRKDQIFFGKGLDSTLALLVCVKTFDLLDLPREGIVAVTMPGFGTTARTLGQARELGRALRVRLREIDIQAACRQHIQDIGLDPEDRHSAAYQNLQARERTQVLMDLANMEGAINVGTSDLSEMALGFSTFAGDHISMYNVNGSVPKTLVKALVRWVADHRTTGEERAVLVAVLDTPISPELVPPGAQGSHHTEDIVGPYELHDFFLFSLLRLGAGPRKILFLASHAFERKYDAATLRKWLRVFITRFFAQQFKRSVCPDGPKVGSVSLSPRGDWRMPSDASAAAWLRDLDDV